MREEGRKEGRGEKEKRKDRSEREVQVRNMGKVKKTYEYFNCFSL